MLRKIMTMALLAALAVTALADNNGLVKKSRIAPVIKTVNPDSKMLQAAKGPYTGLISTSFDKAGHGNGWIYGYNRKVQWNQKLADGSDLSMVGSIYRKLNGVKYGTIGGMVGTFGSSLLSLTATLYDVSLFWGDTPGGRYPNANEFINGYFFAQFNDFDTVTDTNSWGMYAVADATWGYDWTTWSGPKRLEATDGGASIPGAWTGTGDVVYDSATGYYYWTQNFGEGGLDGGIDGAINSTCVGRTKTPADLDSWVWSDYKDLRFDGVDDTVGITSINEFHTAYCKDVYGNGTGYGITMSVANDVDDNVIIGDSTAYTQNPKLSWMYTTNWGGDDLSGDWKPNWITPAPDKLYKLEMKDIFDWYGETLTSRDSIGLDGSGNIVWDTTEVLIMNDPFITWNISNIATENNNVHVLFKAFPGTSDDGGGSLYSATDAGLRSGYYHLGGKITDAGVVWNGKAKYIGSIVDMDKGWDFVEWTASNRNWMSIGYAGEFLGDPSREVIYTQWIDKPVTRAVANTYATESIFLDDAFFTSSTDGGNNWDYSSIVNIPTGDENYPVWTQTYAYNLTKTGSLHEMGFVLANHGSVNPATGAIQTYGAHQYYDPANPVEPVGDLNDFNQFLHVWKITGQTNGIETEEVSITGDFTLEQNYPNPFNPSTKINFTLDKDSKVQLAVYNVKGESVAILCSGEMVKGIHSINFDASNMNSGIYFYKLTVNGMTEARKMVLTK